MGSVEYSKLRTRGEIRESIISRHGSITGFLRKNDILTPAMRYSAANFFNGRTRYSYSGSNLSIFVEMLQKEGYSSAAIDLSIREKIHSRSISGGAA